MSQYIDPIHLRQVLTEHYDLGELHTLCFDLGIDYEEIGGSGKTEKVVELVAFAQRHNRLDDIAAYVRRTRSTVPLKMTDTLPPLPAAGVGSGASITLHVAGDYVQGDKVGGDKVMGDKHDHHHYRERPAYEPLPLPPQGELPAPGVIPPYSRMALGRNPHFVGREPELHELAARLLYASDGEAQAITTHGIGGMGKSQLAVEYAHRFGRFYHSVYWLNFAEPDSIPAEIAACGLKMAARPDDFARYALAVQVSQTHNEWGGGRLILLIFDNCEDPNLLKQWRPQAGRCRILLTSRRAAWSSHLAQTIKLDTLTRPQSMALLRRLTGTDSPYYETIADEVGDLPLALQLAGNYLREYGYSESPQAYLEALRQHPLRHDSMRGRGSDGSPTDHALSLDATIVMSADKLGGDGVDPLAKRLLTYAAYLAPGEPIPRPLLLHCAQLDDRRDGDDALKRLLDLGLLEGEADGALKLHRTIAAYARSQTADGEPQADVERALYNKTNQLNKAGYPRELLPWQSHLRHVTDAAAAREGEKAADLCNELGYHLQAIGDYEGTRPYFERALAIREKALGPDHPDTALSLNNLGALLRAMGNLAEARPYYERALAIKEKALGPDHPDTALSLNNLGALLRAMGNLAEARPYYQRALAINEKALGPDPQNEALLRSTATSLNNLGYLLQAMGNLAEARPYYQRALAIREKALGPDHPDTALSLNNLGALLDSMGNLAEARPYYQRALAIREKALGPHHPDTALSLNNLGYLLQAMGNLAEARPYYQRALAIREKALGPDHPTTALSLNNLGALLQAMGNLAEARPYYQRALAIREKALGPDHPTTAQSLNNLGYLLRAMGNLAEARPYYERALAIREKALGPDHPDTASSLNNLGYLLQAMGNLAEARPYYERALAIREKALGPDHPTTATSLNNLGYLLQAMGNLAEARPYYQRALAIDEKALGPDHPDTAIDLNNLGYLLQAMGNLAEARPYYQRALAIVEKSLGANHPNTKIVRGNLSNLDG